MRQPPVRSYIHIAEPSARATLRGISAVLGEDRDHERQQLDEVRRVAAQPLALVERLVDEADVALLQVAQAAVDELGALRRRAAGEVVALDERRAQAPRGGVEGDAGAGDAAADDEHVERLGGEALEHRVALERRGTRASAARRECRSGDGSRPLREARAIASGAARIGFYRSCSHQTNWMGDSYVSLRDIEWRKLGACRGLDASIFYPDDDDDAAAAKAVCAEVRRAGRLPRARPDLPREGRRVGRRHRARASPDHPPAPPFGVEPVRLPLRAGGTRRRRRRRVRQAGTACRGRRRRPPVRRRPGRRRCSARSRRRRRRSIRSARRCRQTSMPLGWGIITSSTIDIGRLGEHRPQAPGRPTLPATQSQPARSRQPNGDVDELGVVVDDEDHGPVSRMRMERAWSSVT